MKTIEIKRLWKGRLASIRDYNLEKAISEGGLVIKNNGKKMTLNPDQIKDRMFQCHPQTFKSKFGEGSYKLYDFDFKADE